MLCMQDCAPVPTNTTFAVSALFPVNKSYYAYRYPSTSILNSDP